MIKDLIHTDKPVEIRVHGVVIRGAKGDAPERGVDYWTEDDQEAIKNDAHDYIDADMKEYAEDAEKSAETAYSAAETASRLQLAAGIAQAKAEAAKTAAETAARNASTAANEAAGYVGQADAARRAAAGSATTAQNAASSAQTSSTEAGKFLEAFRKESSEAIEHVDTVAEHAVRYDKELITEVSEATDITKMAYSEDTEEHEIVEVKDLEGYGKVFYALYGMTTYNEFKQHYDNNELCYVLWRGDIMNFYEDSNGNLVQEPSGNEWEKLPCVNYNDVSGEFLFTGIITILGTDVYVRLTRSGNWYRGTNRNLRSNSTIPSTSTSYDDYVPTIGAVKTYAQPKLVAGDNITISGNTISASGGGGSALSVTSFTPTFPSGMSQLDSSSHSFYKYGRNVIVNSGTTGIEYKGTQTSTSYISVFSNLPIPLRAVAFPAIIKTASKTFISTYGIINGSGSMRVYYPSTVSNTNDVVIYFDVTYLSAT